MTFQMPDGVYLRKYEPFQFIFFWMRTPRQPPPPFQQCTLSTVFWYYGEIQEKTSSNKVATQKILTVNQNCTPFLFSLFFFCILNFKVGGSDTPPLWKFVLRPDRYKAKFSVLQGACVVGELWRLHLTFYTINLKRNIFKRMGSRFNINLFK